ncbi:site-2 protease family protein [Solibacillus sp. CAU 1738]|uniref:site-2 protease family protein n=1 Tax=Solibacillus sp. CAU 1738 TaxID=3140363 RepID=UPI003261C52E
MQFLTAVITCLLYAPIVTLIHEFGHATFVKLFKGNINIISLGVGNEIFRFKKLSIRKNEWWRGYCGWNIGKLESWKEILILLGGFIFNISSATIIWIFADTQYADWYRSFIYLSYAIGFFSIYPYKMQHPIRDEELESDGLQCLNLIKSINKGA